MITCEQANELISAELDGELTQQERDMLSAHLDICPSCRILAAQLRQIHLAFLDLEEYTPPADFTTKVTARVVHASGGSKSMKLLFSKPIYKRLASLAACALLCIGVFRAQAYQRYLHGEINSPDTIPTSSSTSADLDNLDTSWQQPVTPEIIHGKSETIIGDVQLPLAKTPEEQGEQTQKPQLAEKKTSPAPDTAAVDPTSDEQQRMPTPDAAAIDAISDAPAQSMPSERAFVADAIAVVLTLPALPAHSEEVLTDEVYWQANEQYEQFTLITAGQAQKLMELASAQALSPVLAGEIVAPDQVVWLVLVS